MEFFTIVLAVVSVSSLIRAVIVSVEDNRSAIRILMFSIGTLALLFVGRMIFLSALGHPTDLSMKPLKEGIIYTRISDPTPDPEGDGYLVFLQASGGKVLAYRLDTKNIPDQFLVYQNIEGETSFQKLPSIN